MWTVEWMPDSSVRLTFTEGESVIFESLVGSFNEADKRIKTKKAENVKFRKPIIYTYGG